VNFLASFFFVYKKKEKKKVESLNSLRKMIHSGPKRDNYQPRRSQTLLPKLYSNFSKHSNSPQDSPIHSPQQPFATSESQRDENSSSILSMELFGEGIRRVEYEDSNDDSELDETSSRQCSGLRHTMRRNSLEEMLVQNSSSPVAIHAILEKPKLKRWDSGDYFSIPEERRGKLAVQGREMLKSALEKPEPSNLLRTSSSLHVMVNSRNVKSDEKK
jgi:hypothetical protein